MTFRRISIELHSALELGVAAAIMAGPFVFDLSVEAGVTAVVVGALLFGLALSTGDGVSRGSLPLAAHAAYDSLLALVLIAAALGFGFAGDMSALALLLVGGVVQLALGAITRYTPAPRVTA